MTILDALYLLVGIIFATTAIINLRDSSSPKRWKSASFWGINVIIFIFSGAGQWSIGDSHGAARGDRWIDRSKQLEGSVEQREVRASCFGNRLFIPALLIPTDFSILVVVGKLVTGLMTDVILPGVPIVVAAAYCIGMALFIIIMGNAFVAFS